MTTMLLYGALLMAAAEEERHPVLHFDAAGLPALRARCRADAVFWPRVRQAADDLLKPGAVARAPGPPPGARPPPAMPGSPRRSPSRSAPRWQTLSPPMCATSWVRRNAPA